MTSRLRILAVGQVPPPYGGQAVMLRRVLDVPPADVDFEHVDLRFNEGIGSSGLPSLRKVRLLLGVIGDLIRARLRHRDLEFAYYLPGGATKVSLVRDFVLLNVLRALDLKLILHFHASGVSEVYPSANPVIKALMRATYRRPHGAIVLSELAPADAAFVRAPRVAVVPNGVPDPLADSSLRAAGTLVQADDDRGADPHLRVAFMGIVGRPKGAERLLDAAALIRERGTDLHVDLIGEVDQKLGVEGLRDLIRSRDLEGRVAVHGVLVGHEKVRALRRADVFCFPTLFEHETFPLVVIEAMSLGIPPVVSDWRALPDIVTDGVDGLVVPGGEPAGLADRLLALADVDYRMQLGRSARETYERRFEVARFDAAMAEALTRLCR